MARSIQIQMRTPHGYPDRVRPGVDAPAEALSWRAALGLWATFALAGWALTGMALLVMA